MRSHSNGTLHYYTFDSFPSHLLTHAIFGRQGGVSPIPYDSLNMSTSTGDSLHNVRQNHALALGAMELSSYATATLWQVHKAKTIIVGDKPCDPSTKADALVTDRPKVSLFLRFADCVPIMLVDPIREAIGIVHAGWRGTVRGVTQTAVRAMISEYGCRPDNIMAGIGPSIGPEHYNVGPDVAESIELAFPDADHIITNRDGCLYLDLWALTEVALRECGVRAIESSRMCTASNREQFFSHRAEHGSTGRFGAVIALQN